MSNRYEEHNIQVLLCRYLREHNYHFFAIPNGWTRTPLEGRLLKSEGVVPGVSDMIIFSKTKSGVLYFIEVKTPHGAQSSTQIEFQKFVESQNFIYKIIRSVDELKDFLKDNP